MAGGRGERFWPESRLSRPKQLLPIVGDTPMLSQTIDRLEGLVPAENIFIITNEEQRAAVLEVCPSLDPAKIVGEPMGRDTAAAVALATVLVRRESPEASFAMLPADAVIHDGANFRKVLEAAFAAAEAEPVLTTIGIKASHPATGYGYIQQGAPGKSYAGKTLYSVKRFVEKPDAETAKAYLASGDYFWNAGMFVWTVPTIVTELEKNTPQLWKSCQAIAAGLDKGEGLSALLAEYYPQLEKISIDYAVIEKAETVTMIESSFDWDDVGEWPAIERHYPKDENGNVVRGNAHAKDAKNNIVYARDDGHLVTLLGVDELIVVHTKDATLICKKEQAQQIKALVKEVGAKDAWKHLM